MLHQTSFADLEHAAAIDLLPQAKPPLRSRHAAHLDQEALAELVEVVRLLVHGTLHALGYDHPEGERRTRSKMWRRQERYVEALA